MYLLKTSTVLQNFSKLFQMRRVSFEASIVKVASKGNLKTKIKPLRETRWLGKQIAFEDLFQLYRPVLFVLIQFKTILVRNTGLMQSQ